MRILAAISTFARPFRLSGVLHSLTVNQSGKHDVRYVVRVNSDDQETRQHLVEINREWPIEVLIGPRPTSLGQCWNEIADDRDWDACAILADKHLCMTQHWDDLIAEAMATGLPAMRWTLLREPLETVLILSRRWYDTTGQIFPEWFPFWFSERWIAEVHQLAFGTGIPRATDLIIHEPTVKTQNLRDLEFWFDFFAKTRILRIPEARKIAAAFGRTMPQSAATLAELRQSDEWQKPRIKGYYETRGGGKSEPSSEYLIAKQRAEAWLAAHATHEEPASAA